MNTASKFTPLQAPVLGLLRIVTAYMLLQHGSTKLLHIPYVEMFANVQVMSLFGAAGVLELVGGILLLLGLFTRPAAFLLCGEMAFAYFIGHVASGGNFLLPMLNGGELAVQWCFVLLTLFAFGGGAFALDNLRCKNKISV